MKNRDGALRIIFDEVGILPGGFGKVSYDAFDHDPA
ncbi:hypothetical protein SAMN05444158_7041 [Bradyrhizobium canariense]|uniref:Uncharacterized protein n=1 Tax=Bradyrhizobium canariense TaxID=255045 RepID=A0A1H2BDC7_9BRAD|nr:hypothetical protein SAMN05444158_7041 [Bradyrhizobium canariense]